MRNVSDGSCRENPKHILCSITVFENLAFYEMMWKNTVQPDRPQVTIWRMRSACWIPKATNTHSEYVILIAFILQQGCTNAPAVLTVLFSFISSFLAVRMQHKCDAEELYEDENICT